MDHEEIEGREGQGTLRAGTILGVKEPPQLFLLDEGRGAVLEQAPGAKTPDPKLR